MTLDLRTIAFLAGSLGVIFATLVVVVGQTLPRALKPGACIWAAGTLSYGLGFLALGVSDELPVWLTRIVGNFAILFGAALFVESLTRLYGLPGRAQRILSIVLISGCLVLNLQAMMRELPVNLRFIVGSLAQLTLSLMVCATVLWVPRRERRLGLYILLFAFGLHALSLVHRAIGFLFAEPLWSPLAAPTMQALSYYAALLVPVLGGVGFLQLCAERVSEEMARIADVDHLTGALNRRAIERLGEGAIERARRHGRGLSLLLLDLDDLKSVNDRHGHAAGDRVLIRVVERLRCLLRAGDFLARVGGDEFVVILDASQSENADAVGARVRAELAREDHEPPIAVSVGLAKLEGATDDFQALLARADRAMYESKGSGRRSASGSLTTLPSPTLGDRAGGTSVGNS